MPGDLPNAPAPPEVDNGGRPVAQKHVGPAPDREGRRGAPDEGRVL